MGAHENRQSHEDRRRQKIRIGEFGEHESIFKYVSLDGTRSWNYFERTFSDFEVIGSSIHSLNDPYEGRPRFFDDLSFESLRACCEYFDNDGVRRDTQDHTAEGFVEESRSLIDAKLRATHQDARILSFCRRSDSHLLWSHYANSHKGACIHFSVSAFDLDDVSIGSVAYSRYRPVIPKTLLGQIALPPEKRHHVDDRLRLRKELYRAMFFTKPLDWAYEEEFRAIYQTSKMTNVSFDKDKVFEVIIGAKCEEDDAKRIREIVLSSDANVVVREAFIDEDTFSVGIR